MKATRVFVVLAGVALAALPAFGQLPVATLRGRVTTADNAPLPGATVAVSSPALQGTRSATSEENGSYLIGLLPPGDYRIVFEMQGFASAEKDVKLSAAQTTTLDQEMVLEGVTEEIVVTGTYETISAGGQAATTYNYKEIIEKLPVDRNIRDAVLLTAGVSATGPRGGTTRNSNISISGSQSHENLFLVNGVAITENLRGQPFDLFIEDAIEETTTSTSAVSAEYGRFAGGVINTITKSGGNELHGSFRANLENDDWIASSNPLHPERTDELNETYEATLGGWLWRDKAWYFLAGRDRERLLTRTTGQVDVRSPTNAVVRTPGLPFPEGNDQQRYEGKLTLSPFQGHRLTASYMEIDELELGNRFIVNVLDLASLNDRETPQELRALNYNGVLTENFFVEAQYSEREFTFIGSGSRFTDLIKGTLFVDQLTNARWHSPTFCGVCRPEERDNENLLLKASYFWTSETLGAHDLVVGYDTFTDVRAADNHQSGSDFRILLSNTVLADGQLYPVFIPRVPPVNAGTIIQFNPILVSSQGTDFTTNSYFLNDRWRLNDRWSFNLGVRYDENDGVNGAGQQVASDSKISPRLGLTWDPKGDGDWLFNASYGHYVAAIASTQADSTSQGGNPAAFTFWYRGPAINVPGSGAPLIPADTALQMLWDWFDSVGGVNTADTTVIRTVDIPGGTTVIGGGSLDSPHTVEYTLGATKRLGTRGLVRADLVHRDGQDFYVSRVDLETGSVITPTGRRANLEVVENNDSVLEREYNGLHTQFQYRFTDRLNIGGVYTLSHAEGNWDGETAASGPIRSDVLAFPEYKELEWNAPTGDLGIDQRHRVRLFGTYDVFRTEHHSLNVGLLQVFNSGTPYGAQANIPASFQPNPGYAIAPAAVQYWFKNRDEFHTDDVSVTALSLNYGFTWGLLGKEIEVFVQPELFNVFDEDGQEVVNTTVQTAANAGSGLSPFNPFTTTPVEGVHWRKGANFGKSTNELELQQPRTFRLSVGFRF
ncbi:MAG TPA: TonB-dependent receptor [Thermoanaerobaculia bacterium]|nr:TonB-dependent receptor [Thermoanaerobaculia bacterium]